MEGPSKKYSPEEIATFEESRIHNPNEAHEEANMLSVNVRRERPTAKDYDNALAYLDRLQEEARLESKSADKIIRPIKAIIAGSLVALAAAEDVIPLAILIAVGYTGMASKGTQKELRQKLDHELAEIGDYYKSLRDDLASARERLEKWKTEAEEFAKKQNETPEHSMS